MRGGLIWRGRMLGLERGDEVIVSVVSVGSVGSVVVGDSI